MIQNYTNLYLDESNLNYVFIEENSSQLDRTSQKYTKVEAVWCCNSKEHGKKRLFAAMMIALATRAPNALNFQAVENAQQQMLKILRKYSSVHHVRGWEGI